MYLKEIYQTHLHKLFYEVETPLIPVLTEMEYEGVKIDTDFLRQYSKEISQDIVALKDEILNSPVVHSSI